ncbi:hypothetical protein HB884_05085 [Listeria booriae]|uniref:hypothetical protein n=1 Tax=Listeria booriae TaxID=1552123 RepID=UPI001625EC4A|nr:hypothetical protein [Listeria booriae]MBC1523579.1 hypothetical protein [Listeria booriae]
MTAGEVDFWGKVLIALVSVVGTITGVGLTIVFGFISKKIEDNKDDRMNLNRLKVLEDELLYQVMIVDTAISTFKKSSMLTTENFEKLDGHNQFFHKVEPSIDQIGAIFTEMKNVRCLLIKKANFNSFSDKHKLLLIYTGLSGVFLSQKEDYKIFKNFKVMFDEIESLGNDVQKSFET